MASTVAGSEIVRCPACGRRNRVRAVASGTPRCAECHRPLPWLVEANDATFDELSAGRLPVLVDLWAPWCGPCRMVSPAVEQAAQHFAGQLKALKVNVDEAPRTSQRFGVRSVPTLLVVRDGREVARQVGAVPAAALERWLAGQLETPTGTDAR
jgi:thioredoxin 2